MTFRQLVSVLVILPITGTAALATPYQILHSFNGSSGSEPISGVVTDGSTLYGAAADDNLFKLNSDGTGYQVLKLLSSSDGQSLLGGLTLVGSTLFGEAEVGGANGYGTLFSIGTDGTGFQVLHSFTGTSVDGNNPVSAMTLVGSTLYGTTGVTIYSINTDGTGFQVLHTFGSISNDGGDPFASLTLDGGQLYGTTRAGGIGGEGTVFRINPDGSGYQVLHSFNFATEGFNAQSGLTLVGSTLYGTLEYNTAGGGALFSIRGAAFNIVHDFSSSEGIFPMGGLTLVGSRLYGTLSSGGSDNRGTLFSINPDGTGLQVLHNFGGSSDGLQPEGDLTLSGSTLFGTTLAGGILANGGTVYAYQVPEPSTSALMMAGVVLLWFARKWRARAAS